MILYNTLNTNRPSDEKRLHRTKPAASKDRSDGAKSGIGYKEGTKHLLYVGLILINSQSDYFQHIATTIGTMVIENHHHQLPRRYVDDIPS